MTNPKTTLMAIKAPRGQRWMELTWEDGTTRRLPTALARGYCPCAQCQGHSGPIEFVGGHDDELLDITEVGRYGLRLVWGDGHETGIYTFPYLRELSELAEQYRGALPTQMPTLHRLG